jgi:hypothetical protein
MDIGKLFNMHGLLHPIRSNQSLQVLNCLCCPPLTGTLSVPYLISAKGTGFFWLYRALSSAHWKFAQLTGNPLRTADTTELVFAVGLRSKASLNRHALASVQKASGSRLRCGALALGVPPKRSTTKVPLA